MMYHYVSGAMKMRDMNMSKVTTEQVSQWVGDGFNVGFFNSREEALLEIITDVANGKYDIAELNADIMQWEDFKRICE